MKNRHHSQKTANGRSMKRRIYARMWHDLFYGQPIGQFLGTFRHVISTPLPDSVVIEDLSGSLVDAFRQGMAEQAAMYVVRRVKDNEVVLATESRTEVLMLVEKHARQKRAKLHVFQDGEQVLFSEDETINA